MSGILVRKVKHAIGCLLVAFIAVLVFGKDYIESDHFLPQENIEIKVIGKNEASVSYEVWIEEISGIGLKDAYGQASAVEHFEYRDGETFGYLNDVIVNDASEDSCIVLNVRGGKGKSITFWRQGLSAIVLVSTRYGEQEIDLYSAQEEDYLTVEVFPQTATLQHMFIRIAVFFTMWLGSFLVVLILYKLRNPIFGMVRKFMGYMKHGKHRKVIGAVLLSLYLLLLIVLYWNERK